MKIVLHIGCEKTGTTAIQQRLYSESNLSQFGAMYVGDLLVVRSAATSLVLASKRSVAPSELWPLGVELGRFREDMKSSVDAKIRELRSAGITTAVFSSEHMSSRLIDESEVRALKELFPSDATFQIVIYVRRQSDLYLGAVAESIKSGTQRLVEGQEILISAPTSLDEYEYGWPYFDYMRLISPWSQVFGESSLCVRPYERNSFPNGDVVADFLVAIRLPADAISMTDRTTIVNSRLSPEMLIFLSIVGLPDDERARDRLVRAAEAADHFPLGSVVTNDVLAAFDEEFDRSNRALATRFLGRDTLFAETRKEIREVPSDVMRRDSLLFRDIAVRFVAELARLD